jgi:quercetin dioxygenase-like cupin family protein
MMRHGKAVLQGSLGWLFRRGGFCGRPFAPHKIRVSTSRQHRARARGRFELKPRNTIKEAEETGMQVFDLAGEAAFDPKKHVEKILGKVAGGDVTVACWEPGQISPNHCHPHATEIYFCFTGGGTMRTPQQTVAVAPGGFVVHPPGELHEYENGTARTLLFRVRYGTDMAARHFEWRGRADFKQSADDADYFRHHPPGAERAAAE